MIEGGSEKHSSRVDENMRHEVEGIVQGGSSGRLEEWLEPEPVGEDEPDLRGAELTDMAGTTPDGIGWDGVEQRSELAAALGRAVFPAERAALLDHLAAEHAPDRLADLVRRLPAGTTYANVGDVAAALGLGHEQHRF